MGGTGAAGDSGQGAAPEGGLVIVFCRHCEERELRSNPVRFEKDTGLLRFTRNDGRALRVLRPIERVTH